MVEVFEIITVPMAQVNFSGGVGNIVAAALETKGLIDQASILENFRETLELIAAAAWLFSICLAIGAVAVFGSYQQGLYLLLGPPLFFYMTTATIQTDGARAIFGEREITGGIEEQKNLLEWVRAIGEGNETVNISFFFGVFDSVVTEVVQSVVAVLLDEENNAHLRYVAREHVLAQLLRTQVEDSNLINLVFAYNVGECGGATSNLFSQISRNENVEVVENDNRVIDALANKALSHEWNLKNVAMSTSIKRYLIGLKNAEGGSEIPFENEHDVQTVSCSQIWSFTRTALLQYAREVKTIENILKTNSPNSSIPMEEVLDDVDDLLERSARAAEEAGTPGNQMDADRVLAAFIYKNMLTTNTHSALQSQVFTRSPTNAAQFEAVFGSLGETEAHSGYHKIRYFSSTVPYLQGIMIYFLCIAFPFFAVFLVMPGKATSFLVWCALWAWVKSWDIGFAIVHVVREIYWQFMGDQINTSNINVEWSDDPTSIYRFIFSNDPLFNQSTYWIISSILTVSVPFLTAHLALGASSFLSFFSNSLDQTVTRFGNLEGNAARRHKANITERAQYEHGAKTQRQGAQFGMRNNAAQTITGRNIAMQNLKKGPFYGAFSKDKDTGKIGFTKGLTDARPHYSVATAAQAQELLQVAGYGNLGGGISASVQKSIDLEKANKAVNEQARILRGSGDEAALDKLRGENGYDTKESRANLVKLRNDLNAATSSEDKKSLKAQIKKNEANYQQGQINLPESIPNIDRGGFLLNDEKRGVMDKLAMQRYVSDSREMAAVFDQFDSLDSKNQAKAFRKKARSIQKMIDKGESLTWIDYFKRERVTSDDMQERLTVETRRKQYLLKRGAGRDLMKNRLDNRQKTSLQARHFFDQTENLRDLSIAGVEAFHFNPEGTGREHDARLYGGTVMPKIEGDD